MRRSCSTVVIYSGGLWPYLFSISLMLGSGFPPALPWPTGRRAWVGPLRNCLELAPQTHSPSLFHSLLLSFALLLSRSAHTSCEHFPSPFVTYSLVSDCIGVSRSRLRLTPALSTLEQTSLLSHTLAWIAFTAPFHPQQSFVHS